LTKAAAVFPLAVAMIELPFGALPVSSVGASPLLAAGLLAALVATVAVSAIAMRADRHASSRAGLDNGSGPVAG